MLVMYLCKKTRRWDVVGVNELTTSACIQYFLLRHNWSSTSSRIASVGLLTFYATDRHGTIIDVTLIFCPASTVVCNNISFSIFLLPNP